jgi:two-component system sensor histidine kinase KdpD
MRSFNPGKVAIFVPDNGRLQIAAGDYDYPLSDKEMAITKWVYDNGEPAGKGTDTLAGGLGYYVPMKAHGHVHGVLAFAFQDPESVLSLETKGVPVAMAQVGALALERAKRGS